MRTKICGINDKDDMARALSAGASALGFLVGITHVAEDKVDLDTARHLISIMPPFTTSVAVTHLTNAEDISELVSYIMPTTVQIHDYMPPEEVRQVREALPGIKIIKAIHVTGPESLDLARSFEPVVDALLLDSRTANRLGGTGLTHDWDLSSLIVQNSRIPVILAGGLNPENVYQAVKKVHPFAVDVNSGVETNQKKDYQKIIKFICEANQAEQDNYL